MSWSSQWSLTFWHSHQYPICIPLLPHSCYMPYPSQPPWLDHSNYSLRRVQAMKFLIIQLSPTSCHFISLRSKYTNLYLSILLYYFTYNNTITVTMQLNNLICMFSFPFSLHVSASVGHHQVLFPPHNEETPTR
jgi:hypothetical protein